jgi:hypothetical protein
VAGGGDSGGHDGDDNSSKHNRGRSGERSECLVLAAVAAKRRMTTRINQCACSLDRGINLFRRRRKTLFALVCCQQGFETLSKCIGVAAIANL